MKKIISIIFVLMILVFIYMMSAKPHVIVKNNTVKPIYVLSGESRYGVEPDPAKIDGITKARPDVIMPGEVMKISPSFSSLMKDDSVIDLGWNIGARYEHAASGGGGWNFLLSDEEGACSISVVVNEGYNNDSFDEKNDGFCYKKMKPFRYKYQKN